jgi:hypothetical protein
MCRSRYLGQEPVRSVAAAPNDAGCFRPPNNPVAAYPNSAKGVGALTTRVSPLSMS